MANTHNKKPVFLNLLQIRMPVTAVVSIGHRFSGLILFICIPVLIYYLDKSLQSAEEFAAVLNTFSSSPVKWIAILLIWVFVHHLVAGIRFLLIDIDIGVDKKSASISAWLTLLVGFIVLVGGVACLL